MNQVFISYPNNPHNRSDANVRLRSALLGCLLREREIENWVDYEIRASETWETTILACCESTDMVLLLTAESNDAEWMDRVRRGVNRDENIKRLILPYISHFVNETSRFTRSARAVASTPSEYPEYPGAREIRTYRETDHDKPLDKPLARVSQDQPSCPLNQPVRPSQFVNPRSDHDDPPDDLNVPPEPATYEIPGLSEQSLHTYLDVMLQETSDADRQQIQQMGKQIKARRRSLELSRNELAEQLDIPIECILLAETGYGEVETVRELLEQTQRLQNEVFRLH